MTDSPSLPATTPADSEFAKEPEPAKFMSGPPKRKPIGLGKVQERENMRLGTEKDPNMTPNMI